MVDDVDGALWFSVWTFVTVEWQNDSSTLDTRHDFAASKVHEKTNNNKPIGRTPDIFPPSEFLGLDYVYLDIIGFPCGWNICCRHDILDNDGAQGLSAFGDVATSLLKSEAGADGAASAEVANQASVALTSALDATWICLDFDRFKNGVTEDGWSWDWDVFPCEFIHGWIAYRCYKIRHASIWYQFMTYCLPRLQTNQGSKRRLEIFCRMKGSRGQANWLGSFLGGLSILCSNLTN